MEQQQLEVFFMAHSCDMEKREADGKRTTERDEGLMLACAVVLRKEGYLFVLCH